MHLKRKNELNGGNPGETEEGKTTPKKYPYTPYKTRKGANAVPIYSARNLSDVVSELIHSCFLLLNALCCGWFSGNQLLAIERKWHIRLASP